jgi:putative transposase
VVTIDEVRAFAITLPRSSEALLRGRVRRECLDRLLIVNRRQFEHILRVYTSHYNRHTHTKHSRSSRPTTPHRHAWTHRLGESLTRTVRGVINEYRAAA